MAHRAQRLFLLIATFNEADVGNDKNAAANICATSANQRRRQARNRWDGRHKISRMVLAE